MKQQQPSEISEAFWEYKQFFFLILVWILIPNI